MIDYLKLKYTKKQRTVFRQMNREDWSIMVNSGAVGSGKTVIDNDIFIRELLRISAIAEKTGKKAQYILAGYSSSTIANNVLQELQQAYPMLHIKFDKHNAFELFGVRVVQAFTGNKAGVKSIRGMNAWGAYVNEASTADEEAFKEIRNRVRGFEGARMICDTNPDHPNHWLKKTVIDLADTPGSGIIYNHFTMDDNTFLPAKYVHDMKAQMSGVFYDRSILGLWVAGEGAVYSDFDRNLNYVKPNQLPRMNKYVAGVDWGFEHWGCIIVVGVGSDGKYYVVDEVAKKHKQIDFWINQAHELEAKYGRMVFWCDTNRPEHINNFVINNIDARFANKRVLDGIEMVSGLIKTRRLLIVEENVDLLNQNIYEYMWDTKTGNVIKQNDDAADPLRYAIYNNEQTAQTTSISDIWG